MKRAIVIVALALVPAVALGIGAWRTYWPGGELPPLLTSPKDPLLPDLTMKPLADVQSLFSQSGSRQIHFSATIANAGDGPLIVHAARSNSDASSWRLTQRFREPDGTLSERGTPGTLVWGGHGHNHWHARMGASYELRSLDGKSEPRSYVKAGFCFFDQEPYRLGLPGALKRAVFPKNICSDHEGKEVQMGLSVGWQDPYYWILPDQAIDITGLPEGDYRLTASADPENWFRETSERNNSTWVDIRLSSRASDGAPLVEVIRSSNG